MSETVKKNVFTCSGCGMEMSRSYRSVCEVDKQLCRFCYAGNDNPLKVKEPVKEEKKEEVKVEVKEEKKEVVEPKKEKVTKKVSTKKSKK